LTACVDGIGGRAGALPNGCVTNVA
jgi:hypothetical protein